MTLYHTFYPPPNAHPNRNSQSDDFLFILCCTNSYVTKKIQTLGAMYPTRGATPVKNPWTPSSFTIFDAHDINDPPYAFVVSVIINVLILSSGLVMAAEKEPAAAPHIAASSAESDMESGSILLD